MSSPSPPSRTSVPGPPISTSSSSPPSSTSLPSPPMSTSAPKPPSAVNWMAFSQPVIGRFRPGDVDLGREAQHRGPGRVADGQDDVVVVRAHDDDVVRLRVARPAGGGKVEVRLDEVRPAEVVDHDRVGAAQGVEVDRLDLVQVHRHVGNVAEEPHPVPDGGDADVLADVGAVEGHAVEPSLALQRVVVIARIIVSSPAWPSTTSEPWPGSHWNVSLP